MKTVLIPLVKDLVELLNPRYLEVWGKFTPRGGISIDPYYNYGRPETKYEKMAEQRLFNHDLYQKILIIVNITLKVLMKLMGFFILLNTCL